MACAADDLFSRICSEPRHGSPGSRARNRVSKSARRNLVYCLSDAVQRFEIISIAVKYSGKRHNVAKLTASPPDLAARPRRFGCGPFLRLYCVIATCCRGTPMKPSRVRPLSHLKSRAAEMIRNIIESREPMLITQNGEAKVVVQDVQSFEDLQQTLALLKILAMGQRSIETGQCYDAVDVFTEIERQDRAEGVQ
jgi:prevent-host-death family protein